MSVCVLREKIHPQNVFLIIKKLFVFFILKIHEKQFRKQYAYINDLSTVHFFTVYQPVYKVILKSKILLECKNIL